jgi:hypothetical protein
MNLKITELFRTNFFKAILIRKSKELKVKNELPVLAAMPLSKQEFDLLCAASRLQK